MVHCEQCGEEHKDKLKICPYTGKLFALERFFTKATVLDGKYRLERLVAASEAAVFTATHTLLDKKVAVKILFPEADLKETTKQMIREARAVSATGHPNIVAITDLGLSPEGALFIVMEYVEGPTLADVIRREAPLSISRAVWLISEILSGLAAVAKKGITHQDLTASNVMLIKDDLGQQAVKIMDFCVGRVTRSDPTKERKRPTRSGKTLIYLAPEQVRGKDDIDQRTDIYACGAILYHLITGHPPFGDSDQVGLIASILEGDFARPSSLAPSLPDELDRIIMRAMSGDRSRRFASAAELRAALKPFLSSASDEDLEWSPPGESGSDDTPRQVTLELGSPDPAQPGKAARKPAKPVAKPAARRPAGRKREKVPTGSKPALEATMAATTPTGERLRPLAKKKRPPVGKSIGLEAPDRGPIEPIASQEIFQELDSTSSKPDKPDRSEDSREVSLDLSALEGDVVPLDGLDAPSDAARDDLELDLDGQRIEDEQFLPGPDEGSARPGPGPGSADDDERDRFRPNLDDGTEPLSMLEVADDPFHSGGMTSRGTGRHERVSGPHDAVHKHRATGSAAFEGEQEDDFHRSALLVLAVLFVLGAALAAWPERLSLWTSVTDDYSASKMLHLETVPADADVYVNGRLEKSRPIRFAEADKKIDLRVQAVGFASKTLTGKTDDKAPVKVVLKKR